MQDCCFVCFGMFCVILFRWCSWWFWWIAACYFSLTYCLHFNKFVCGCQGLSDSHWWAVRYLHVHELLHAILVTYVTWWPWTLLLIVWRKKKKINQSASHLRSLHCSWCAERHSGLAVESLTFACRVSGTRKSCISKELQGRGLCWDSNGKTTWNIIYNNNNNNNNNNIAFFPKQVGVG